MGSFTPPPTTALAPGDRLDRYELLCILAQGGMGTVWLARLTGKLGFERQVALKTILPTYGNDRQFSDMFLDEARIASQIDHENVARILEIGEDRGILYHAMELVDGESLRKLYRDIRQAGAPFPLAVALRVSADLCAGLQAVHELRDAAGVPLDVVHRDVSPQNVLVTVRGTVKLIDFGVAKARARRSEETAAGTLKGKIEYMAPEQAGGIHVDRRADVYAVGAVLYELLAGAPVRSTEDGRQLAALHDLITGVPYAPLPPSVPAEVRHVVDRALARDPEERFRTTEEMRRALEQVMTALGEIASTDDVASVLAHFSRERIARRRAAIEAAVHAARAAEEVDATTDPKASIRSATQNMVVPESERAPAGAFGPQGTPVIETARAVGEGPSTGPSMATIQGASLSQHPTALRSSSLAKVLGAVAVLGLVAGVGVVAGVVASQNGLAPSGARPAETFVPATPVQPLEVDAGAVTPSALPEASSVVVEKRDAAPTTSVKPPRRLRPARPSAPQKPVTDEYGF